MSSPPSSPRILFEHTLRTRDGEVHVKTADDTEYVELKLQGNRIHVDDLGGLIPKLRAAERFLKNRRADRARDEEAGA